MLIAATASSDLLRRCCPAYRGGVILVKARAHQNPLRFRLGQNLTYPFNGDPQLRGHVLGIIEPGRTEEDDPSY